MLRRRKRLGIAPESPASGARFVGQGLEDSILCHRNASHHHIRFFEIQARREADLKNKNQSQNAAGKAQQLKP
jgi:hypothetical protein